MKIKTVLTVLCLFEFVSGYCQYCMTGGPNSTADSNTESIVLNGVGGGINYIGCPGITGIEDLTSSQNVILNAGNSYTVYIEFGTCNGNYTSVGEAWIDFNNNESFEPSESIGTWQGTPPSSVIPFTFTVPATATNTNTRMRVMQHEGASAPPLDPCASFTWGSVVDFSISIQNGISCIGYFGDNPGDAIEVTSYPYTDTNSTVICYFNYSYVYNSPDVFYLAILDPQKDSLKVSVCNSDFDTYLTVQNMTGDVIYYNDDHANCSPQSEIIFPTNGLDSVYIVVEGWDNLTGNYILNIDNDYTFLNTSTLHDNWETDKIAVFPNPGSNMINIAGIDPKKISLYSINGKLILQKENSSNSLDISFLSPGIYILEMLYKDQYFREKIIKQ